jgi:glucose-1-phosphate cytidylyltransferase
MKVVILAGGFGTRISEETHLRPKPLIEIGGKPILWHIMNYYSNFGFDDFYILTGFKHELIKNYFLNFLINNDDVKIDLSNNHIKKLNKNTYNWKITVINSGLNTMTGGRLLYMKKFLDENENFLVTYGDGLSNVNLNKLIKFHKRMNTIATLTAVNPPERFGVVDIKENKVVSFREKPKKQGTRINGGFFVFNQSIMKYLKNEKTILEKEPLETLAKQNKLSAYQHDGFWQPMDTLRDKNILENLWKNKKALWKIW